MRHERADREQQARQIIDELKKEGYKVHHYATRRGYFRYTCRESYKGKYGEGYIVPLCSTRHSGKTSNNYTTIAYLIK